jgi:hypothetical protein
MYIQDDWASAPADIWAIGVVLVEMLLGGWFLTWTEVDVRSAVAFS